VSRVRIHQNSPKKIVHLTDPHHTIDLLHKSLIDRETAEATQRHFKS
jgi:hypothetical protein